MQTHRTLLGFLLVAVTSTPVIAADSAFGLELGARVALPECAYRMVGPLKLYDQLPTATCVEDAHPLYGYPKPVRTVDFATSERPAIVKNGRAFLLEQDGKLIGIHFLTPGVAAQSVVLEQLSAKYGAPTTMSTQPVQNLTGAHFNAITASWHTPSLIVHFEGIGPKLTYGEVFIDTPEAAGMRQGWINDSATKGRTL